jgi:hypothetical protein
MRVFGLCCLLAGSAFLDLSSTCLANEPAPSDHLPALQSETISIDSKADQGCILHVWPAVDARSSFMGWFHGGAVDGDKRGIKGYPALHSEVLTTSVQRQLLDQIDWSNRLGMPKLSVVVHDQPPAPQDDQTRAVPLIADQSDCYEELIVHSVLVERAVFSATTVRLMIIAKKWRGRNAQPTTFSVMTNDKVELDNRNANMVQTSLKDGFVASVGKALNADYFRSH